MDYKSIVEAIEVSAYVISVDVAEDLSCKDVRFVEANAQYKDMMPDFNPAGADLKML